MKLIEAYNRRLANYEGGIYLDTGRGSQAQGYFEAVQSYDGTIAIGCFFNDVVDIPIGIADLTIEAIDKGVWNLQTSCNQTDFYESHANTEARFEILGHQIRYH